MLEENGIEISAIALYNPGYQEPRDRIERLSAYIELCGELGVEVITAMTGGVEGGTLDENLDYFEEIFVEVAPRAENAGIKIGFENWPGLQGVFPPVNTGNFGFTPEAWEKMFDRVDSPALGLEFDPSHLVWQGIDWAGALQDFASRIHHAHAKDTEILEDKLQEGGFFSAGWWRYRLPGYGRVDWHKFTSLLKENGYDGAICIEHEDPVFSGERWNEGLEKGHDFLRPMI